MSIENIKTYDDLLLEAKEAKYVEVWNECNIHNDLAESQFEDNYTKYQDRTNDKLKKKNDRIANKKLKGQATSPDEDDFIDNWDDCMDWQDIENDIAEVACNAVENYTTTESVQAYDVVNTPTWQSPFTL